MPVTARTSARTDSATSSIAWNRCHAVDRDLISSRVWNAAIGSSGSRLPATRPISASVASGGALLRTIQLGENHVWTIARNLPSVWATGT
jgi:hypothetical protein